MLKNLSIQNYALIESLQIEFEAGLSMITGETGAGKSILLGALSLLVGQRADADVLLDKSRKCVVEATFEISAYNMQYFFTQHEIDYNDLVIVRREILETGRSRAFVNDSPVNLALLKELGDKLIDIHSQHQNSYLVDRAFQLKILDIIARNSAEGINYKDTFRKVNETRKQLTELTTKAASEQTEFDFIQFQYNELAEARLVAGEQADIEDALKTLSHAEDIKTHLSAIGEEFLSDNVGILSKLKDATLHAQKTKSLIIKAESIFERLSTAYIELKDISNEVEKLNNAIESDPDKLEILKQRIDLVYRLSLKHKVSNADELIVLRDHMAERLQNINSYAEQIDILKKELEKKQNTLYQQAINLRTSRKNIVQEFELQIVTLLRQLGMPNASFCVSFEALTEFQSTGLDAVSYLFSANKQIPPQDITKVASGGEISRLMLAIKSVIVSSLAIPAIVFDEIDTGVSGEIADKMGAIMTDIAAKMQVISITHLPQVAAKGKNHYLVYKIEGENTSNSKIRLLTSEERITELAKMLSGKDITEAAISNAKVLLNL